ncbi:MAG: dehypoxanthine futalosine cyclase [Candidatus Krumholzibacteria bacterium]|nr:dehypoxanthine futalosine cyclase [Candidatus Krumholzibacteria bacterium]
MLASIRQKVLDGKRITREEGFYLLTEAPLLDLAPLAQTVRFRHNPDPVVTFVVDTNLNYTNVCDAYCTFCAFYRTDKARDAYTHSIEDMMKMFASAQQMGVTTVLLQGGLNDALPFQYYLDLVRETRRRFPDIHPHFYSAPEIKKMEQISGLSLPQVFTALYEAGLRTIPGGGSEILSDRVKPKLTKLHPKAKSSDWLDVHREAHRAGLRSTATMMYGHIEEDEDIIEHLDVTRQLQDDTGGFTAFIPWSYKSDNTALAKKVKFEAGPNRYLRIIALSRLYLDNFKHIQASWFSEGKKTGVVALNFGGDDFGGTIFDEEVMRKAGHYNRTTIDEVVALIRDAGFEPAQRTTLYDIVHRFDAETEGRDTSVAPRSEAGSI